MLRSVAARAALAAAVLLVAPACSREGQVDFSITETYTITNTAAFGPEVKSVDLAQKPSTQEAWSHRDKVTGVRVTSVTVTASEVTAPDGTTVDGAFAIRPSGTSGPQDIIAARLTGVPVRNAQLIATGGSDAINAAITNALKGDGKIAGVAQATATQVITRAVLTVTITGEVDYKVSAGL